MSRVIEGDIEHDDNRHKIIFTLLKYEIKISSIPLIMSAVYQLFGNFYCVNTINSGHLKLR